MQAAALSQKADRSTQQRSLIWPSAGRRVPSHSECFPGQGRGPSHSQPGCQSTTFLSTNRKHLHLLLIFVHPVEKRHGRLGLCLLSLHIKGCTHACTSETSAHLHLDSSQSRPSIENDSRLLRSPVLRTHHSVCETETSQKHKQVFIQIHTWLQTRIMFHKNRCRYSQ